MLRRSERSAACSGGGAADEEGSTLHAACCTLGCPPDGLEEGISSLLWRVTSAAMRGDGADSSSGGERVGNGKRARPQGSPGGGSGASQPALG